MSRQPFRDIQSLIQNAVPKIEWCTDEVMAAFIDFEKATLPYRDLMLGMEFKLVVEETYRKACGFIHQSENYRIIFLRGFAEDEVHHDWSAHLELRYSKITVKPMRDPDLIALMRKFLPSVRDLCIEVSTSMMEPYAVSNAALEILDEEYPEEKEN